MPALDPRADGVAVDRREHVDVGPGAEELGRGTLQDDGGEVRRAGFDLVEHPVERVHDGRIERRWFSLRRMQRERADIIGVGGREAGAHGVASAPAWRSSARRASS